MLLCPLSEFIFNAMKWILHTSVLLLSFIGVSQNPNSIVCSKSISMTSADCSIFKQENTPFAFNLSDKKNYADKYLLTVYNPTTQLNDTYINTSNKYYLTNKLSYNLNNRKMDSFNPSGVSDFKSAVGIGFLNLLFGRF